MSDIVLLEHKIDGLGEDVRGLTGRFDEIDRRLDDHSDRLGVVEIWEKGNGVTRGAEVRLQGVESFGQTLDKENISSRLNMAEANIETLQHVADRAILEGVQGAVNDTLDKRDRTFIAKMKAWGALITPILAAIAIVLAAVL